MDPSNGTLGGCTPLEVAHHPWRLYMLPIGVSYGASTSLVRDFFVSSKFFAIAVFFSKLLVCNNYHAIMAPDKRNVRNMPC